MQNETPREYVVPQIEVIEIRMSDIVLASGMAVELENGEGGKDYAVDWRW